VATPTASQAADTRAAAVVARVPDCSSWGYPYAISGNDLFVVCYGPSTIEPYIARVNMTTNKVVATYGPDPTKMDFTYIHHVAVDGSQLWIDGTLGSACVDPCTGFNQIVRINLATGKTALILSDWWLHGLGLGYIWATDKSGLAKLDPATGAVKGRIPFEYETLQVACGSLWGLTINDPEMADASTTIARVDPANGRVLATFTEPGLVDELQQVGAECWASAYTGVITVDDSQPDSNHFDRIGLSAIEFRSPVIPSSQGYAALFAGTFWILDTDTQTDNAQGSAVPATLTTMQRIDPATWQSVGPTWTYTGDTPEFAAGGALWAGHTDNANNTELERLNVPLGPIGS